MALITALGVLVVAVAYSAGRHGHADSKIADYGYWAGQALIFVPASVRLLTRRKSTEAGTVAAIVILAVAQYLIKVCYSPLSFTFSDELQHWRTAENILLTGKLFSPNYVLPISPQYPGLEEATTALMQITGLPLFTAGLIVAGIAHLLFIVTLYLFFRNIVRSQRVAGIAILVYSTNPGLAYFDSLFAYQTLGLAFFGVALLATWRLTGARPSDRMGWAAIAMIGIAATVMTHHVTSYMLALSLVLVAAASLLVKDRRSAARSGALALWAIIAAAGWVALVAPQTVSYLWAPVAGIEQSFRAMLAGGAAGGAPATAATRSFSHTVIGGLTVLLLSCFLPVGWWQARRYFSGQAWVLALSLGSVAWYAILAIWLGTSDGSELFGRAASFVYVPTALVGALALRWIIDRVPRLRTTAFLGASLAGVLLMLVDGILNSWPPSWERLPGSHQAGGVERSIGPEEIALGNWMLASLGPGNRVAADAGNNPVVGSYGDQTPILDDAFLYDSSLYSQSVARQAQLQAIRYVLADMRLTRQLPASGQYFAMDPKAGQYTHPLPLADMTKFNHGPGVARIFDSGDLVIYDLSGGH